MEREERDRIATSEGGVPRSIFFLIQSRMKADSATAVGSGTNSVLLSVPFALVSTSARGHSATTPFARSSTFWPER